MFTSKLFSESSNIDRFFFSMNFFFIINSIFFNLLILCTKRKLFSKSSNNDKFFQFFFFVFFSWKFCRMYLEIFSSMSCCNPALIIFFYWRNFPPIICIKKKKTIPRIIQRWLKFFFLNFLTSNLHFIKLGEKKCDFRATKFSLEMY